jgi:hypothetical protein
VEGLGPFGVSAPGVPKCELPCTRQSRNPDGCNPERTIRGHVTIFRHFGNRNTQGCIPSYSQVPKSRLAKSRNELAWMSCDVSAFRYSGHLRVNSLVFASPEIPISEIPKWSNMDLNPDISVFRHPEYPRAKSLVLASPEIPTCDIPKDGVWKSYHISVFRHPGHLSAGPTCSPVSKPPTREIPMDGFPK